MVALRIARVLFGFTLSFLLVMGAVPVMAFGDPVAPNQESATGDEQEYDDEIEENTLANQPDGSVAEDESETDAGFAYRESETVALEPPESDDAQSQQSVFEESEAEEEPSACVSYRTHVQRKGWMGWVSDGSVAGTTGQSKRIEAILRCAIDSAPVR